jgi:hypothetical protein
MCTPSKFVRKYPSYKKVLTGEKIYIKKLVWLTLMEKNDVMWNRLIMLLIMTYTYN